MTSPLPAGPIVSLALAVSRDGFIARAPGHVPSDWCSVEEQNLFLREVELADWSIMGRTTHEAANKLRRRRIVFSATAGIGQWRRPTQLWIDPAGETPASLMEKVAPVHRCEKMLILGGVRVHDWFLERSSIDRIILTIEPVTFGRGLRAFDDPASQNLPDFLTAAGFQCHRQERLNAAGTEWFEYKRAVPPEA